MADCIFCKIVDGEIPSVKVWEDSEFIAILDIKPKTKGMVVVMPKKHFESNIFDMPRVEYKNFMLATKKVAKYMEKGLRVDRVAMVMEGLDIDHAHIKLYPIYGLNRKFKSGAVLPSDYEGYVAVENGHERSLEELKKVADEMRGNQ